MHSHRLRLDLLRLQAETDRLLSQVSALMEGLGDSELEHHRRCRQQLAHQQALVERFTLRMPIIAPLNAGKSTLINSIVGQALLPSDSAAMTMLPTALVLNGKLSEPVLTINRELLVAFEALFQHLQERIHRYGIGWAEKQIRRYPHLRGLLTSLKEGFRIAETTRGRVPIAETLRRLNHIHRLAPLLSPTPPPLSLTRLPRIETPFWQGCGISEGQAPHHFVIVDMPGSNEASQHNLRGVILEQIEQSSKVLLLLDFTQLNNQVAEEVKQTVQ